MKKWVWDHGGEGVWYAPPSRKFWKFDSRTIQIYVHGEQNNLGDEILICFCFNYKTTDKITLLYNFQIRGKF